MATEVFSIKGTLNLDSKAYEKGLDSASRKTKSFGGMLKDAETGSFALLGGIAAIGAGALGFATKAAFTAARTETLGVAMRAVARSTGTSMDALKAQEKALKAQGITTQEARGTLTRFMQAQLDIADATKIARVAQDLAVISGENSSVMTARLTDAISTMNPELLKVVGITLSSKQVFDKYAKTLGKSGDELTEVEKKQALLNLILERGKDVAGAYEDAMGTAGKKMGSLSRLFEEAFNVIGEMFLPILGEAIDTLSDFLKKITPENIEAFIEKIKESTRVLIPLAGAIMIALVPALFAMATGIWTALAPLLPFLAAGALIGLLVVALIDHFGGFEETLKAFSPIIEMVKDVFMDLWSTIEAELLPALKDLWEQVGPVLIPVLKVLAVILGVIILGAILSTIGGIKMAIKIFTIIARVVTFVFGKIKEQVTQVIDGIKGFIDFMINLPALIEETTTSVINWFQEMVDRTVQMLFELVDRINVFFTQDIPRYVQQLIAWFGRLPENIGFVIGRSIKLLLDFADKINKFFTVDIPNFINTTVAWFKTLPKKIGDALTSLRNTISRNWNRIFALGKRFAINVVNAVVGWFRKLPGRIAGTLSSMWRKMVSWFNKTIRTARTSGSKAVSGFVAFFKSLPGKIGGIFWKVIKVVKGWGPKLWAKAKNIAGSFWSGFKKGLGIGSPSFIEEAFTRIAKESSKTLDQVNADITRFNNIAGRTGGVPALSSIGDTINTNSVTTNISGPINIGSEVQADNFLERLSRNTELAQMGLTIDNGK